MRYIKIILLLLFAVQSYSVAQIFNTQAQEVDSSAVPIISLKPAKIEVIDDTTSFYEAEVYVLNRGEGVLKVGKITASCFCSNGFIMENDVYPLSTGKIKIEINKKGLEEGIDSVVFTINSNAQNSPIFFTVKFIEPKEEDSPEN